MCNQIRTRMHETLANSKDKASKSRRVASMFPLAFLFPALYFSGFGKVFFFGRLSGTIVSSCSSRNHEGLPVMIKWIFVSGWRVAQTERYKIASMWPVARSWVWVAKRASSLFVIRLRTSNPFPNLQQQEPVHGITHFYFWPRGGSSPIYVYLD